jgi:ferrous iron transport protein B
MNLKELKIGQNARITTIGGSGELRQHFLDMGMIPGTDIVVTKYAPMGDPIEVTLHGYELTIRLADAEKIEVERISSYQSKKNTEKRKETLHPGLGEGGIYHDRKNEHPLPEGTLLTFALAGNQNSGKTTLFNQLTGSNQHVGNFPGVTVDRKSGTSHPQSSAGHTAVTDLPGIYSLSPYTR